MYDMKNYAAQQKQQRFEGYVYFVLALSVLMFGGCAVETICRLLGV